MRHLHGWNPRALGAISQSEWKVKADQFVQLYKDTPAGQGATVGVEYDNLIDLLEITSEIRAMTTFSVVAIVAKEKTLGERFLTSNEKNIFRIYKAVEYLANQMKKELSGVLPAPGSKEEADLQAQVLKNTVGVNIDRTKQMLILAKDGEVAPTTSTPPESTPPESTPPESPPSENTPPAADEPVDSNPPVEEEEDDDEDEDDDDDDGVVESKSGWSTGKKIAIFGGCALAIGGLYYFMNKKTSRINRLPR